jgi:hypothetical protein
MVAPEDAPMYRNANMRTKNLFISAAKLIIHAAKRKGSFLR